MRRRAVDGAFEPIDLGEIDAVLVAEQAANEHRGGHGVDRHADALALQVLGAFDVLAVDENETVPEHPRGKHRDGDERALVGDEARDVFGAGEFGGIEFEPAGHAVENVARVVVNQEIEIDALDLNVPGVEREHAVVEPAGEGERQFRHFHLPASARAGPCPGPRRNPPMSRRLQQWRTGRSAIYWRPRRSAQRMHRLALQESFPKEVSVEPKIEDAPSWPGTARHARSDTY
jgi:hypothetical protein